MKVCFDWVKDFVGVSGSPEGLAEKLTMSGLEVKKISLVNGATVFETEITSNRPDWLSHIGVARELHAITGKPFSLPAAKFKAAASNRKIKVVLKDKDLCPYYSAVVLEEVTAAKTPDF